MALKQRKSEIKIFRKFDKYLNQGYLRDARIFNQIEAGNTGRKESEMRWGPFIARYCVWPIQYQQDGFYFANIKAYDILKLS